MPSSLEGESFSQRSSGDARQLEFPVKEVSGEQGLSSGSFQGKEQIAIEISDQKQQKATGRP